MSYRTKTTLPLDHDTNFVPGDTVYKANTRKWYKVLNNQGGGETVCCRTLHAGPHGTPFGPMTNIYRIHLKKLLTK